MEENKKEQSAVPEGSGDDTFDEGNIPWHDAGEALIKYLIVANAQAENEADLKALRVECESHLLASLGDSARHADLTVIKPPEVIVAGPIGEGLGICSSIEYKPETDNCTMMTLFRSEAYTRLAACKHAEDTGQVPKKRSDLATLIVTYHKPKALFKELRQEGAKIYESKEYKGVYIKENPGDPRTRFVVTRELDYTKNGYEWLGWLRTGLTLEEGRALMNRWRKAGDREKSMATLVAYVALRANPEVMEKLVKEANKTMSDALREVLLPLYGDELKEYEQKANKLQLANTELIQEKNELAQEKNKLAQEKNEAFRTLAKLVAGADNGGIDPETLAKARELLTAYDT